MWANSFDSKTGPNNCPIISINCGFFPSRAAAAPCRTLAQMGVRKLAQLSDHDFELMEWLTGDLKEARELLDAKEISKSEHANMIAFILPSNVIRHGVALGSSVLPLLRRPKHFTIVNYLSKWREKRYISRKKARLLIRYVYVFSRGDVRGESEPFFPPAFDAGDELELKELDKIPVKGTFCPEPPPSPTPVVISDLDLLPDTEPEPETDND